jgi:hypothetical protein
VSFAAIILCVAFQVFIVVVYFIIDLVWKLLGTPLYITSTIQKASLNGLRNKSKNIL